MGYVRFFRRVRIAPGIALNLAKHGPSVSFGVRGAHLTVGRSGVRKTVGVPGTAVFYRSRDGWHSGIHTGQHFKDAPPAPTRCVILVALLAFMLTLVILAAIVPTDRLQRPAVKRSDSLARLSSPQQAISCASDMLLPGADDPPH